MYLDTDKVNFAVDTPLDSQANSPKNGNNNDEPKMTAGQALIASILQEEADRRAAEEKA